MQRNQREKLLQLQRPEVSTFLESHGDILWVDQSQREQFFQAADTLASLAASHKDSFGLASFYDISVGPAGGSSKLDGDDRWMML